MDSSGRAAGEASPPARLRLRDAATLRSYVSTIKGRLALAMTFLSALLIAIGTRRTDRHEPVQCHDHELFTNQMPSAVSVGNAEMFMARERLCFDRAALNVGTPAAEDAIGRGTLMRKTSDDAWTNYSALPRRARREAARRRVQQQRLALQKLLDAGYADVRANDHDKILKDANEMQAAFHGIREVGRRVAQVPVRIGEGCV